MVFGCQSIENTAKTSVLHRLYAKKRVNYGVFDGKKCKHTEKNHVFEGFFVYMLELASGIWHMGELFSGVWGDQGIESFFWCQSLENTAKTSVLDRLYAEKRVNYGVFDGKKCKNIVKKNNVFEGFFVYMFESASGIGTWKS